MAYRPLFEKLRKVADGEVLLPGLPAHLRNPVLKWIEGLLRVPERNRRGTYGSSVLQRIEARCQIPLEWSPHDDISAWFSLKSHLTRHEEDALEVVNYLLSLISAASQPAYNLEELLRMGGSAWTVGAHGDNACLVERVPSQIQHRYESLSASGRSGEHLEAAWVEMYGRDHSPSEAYDHAVKAVEVAGKPIVSPNNGKTTLGTMIRDFRAKPEKWNVPLAGDAAGGREALLRMMEGVWHGHLRHGDESKPLTVSAPEAEAALHTALTLVHLFSSGLVERVGE